MTNLLSDKLSELISAEEHKELECRYYLQYAKYLLINDTVIKFLHVETEKRPHCRTTCCCALLA